MNEFVALFRTPPVIRNSLIRTGLTLRTFWTAVSTCFAPVHRALPARSPLNAAGPDVTLNVALTVEPGATGSVIAADVFTDVHPLGAVTLNSTPVTGAPVVFVNVTVVSCDEAGEKVCNPVGISAEAGLM